MFYRSILNQALKISWQNKFLWFFGFFVVLLFGNAGVPDILFQTGKISEIPSFIIRGPEIFQEAQFQEFLFNLQQSISFRPFLFSLIALVFLLIFFFFIWLAIVSQASLIKGIDKLNPGGSPSGLLKGVGRPAALAAGFNEGKKYFLSLFALNLLAKLLIFGLLAVTNFPLILLFFKNKNLFLLNLSVLFNFIILIILNIIISFLVLYASAFIVLKQEKIFLAIKNAWHLFIKNWLISLEMAFILFSINFLASLILLVFLILLSFPFILLGIISYYLASSTGLSLTLILGLIFLIIILVLFVSFLAVFQISAWVLLFRELVRGKRGMSKLVRLFSL